MKEKIFKSCIYCFTLISILLLLILISFLYNESHPFFEKHNLIEFVFGKTWNAGENSEFGILYILSASFYIAILGCLISLPLGYGVSLFACFYAKGYVKTVLTWIINILAGIPSIIYGFFGLFVVVKSIEKYLKLSAGETVLAGGIIVSIMVVPYFVSNSIETMEIIK